MYEKAKPLFLICQTGLHAGSGSDLGIVDLPIQRERHTSFPKIEGSSLKGALREAEEAQVLKPLIAGEKEKTEVKENLKTLNRVFGHDGGALHQFDEEELKTLFDEEGQNEEQKAKNTDFAGAIGFTDARLLLFPVKSMKGVFAWITCNKVLRQFATDMGLCEGIDIPAIPAENTVGKGSGLQILKTGGSDKIVLEEYTFEPQEEEKVNQLGEWLASKLFGDDESYWSKKIKTDIIVLKDDDFKDFVNLSTEVITRTKIDNETGTVASGALFTEEYLPAESVLYSLVLAHREFKAKSTLTADGVLEFFDKHLEKIIQIGGNATLGKGLTQTAFLNS